MRNILFVAIEFEPYQTTGAFRSLYFVKYLRRFDINPIVLTIGPNKHDSQLNALRNSELTNIISNDIQVYRPVLEDYSSSKNKFLEAFQMYFKVLDRFGNSWEDNVFNLLPQIIREHQPELIYVSCPPFSAGVISAKISKKFNLPLLVDMRDGWSKWGVTPFATYLHYRLTLSLERKVFQQATRVVTVTKQLADIFKKTHSFLNTTNTVVIPNGYDHKIDLERKIVFKGLREEDRVINITYIGSFYYTPKNHADLFTPWFKKKGHRKLQYTPVKEDWLYRSPYYFLLTLSHLFEKYPELRERVRFTHYGHKAEWLKSMVDEMKLGDIFIGKGFYNFEDLKQELNDTDLFLSTSMKVEDGEDYAIGSKTFDYISHYKPILGFVTPGAQTEFILNSKTGIIFNPDKIEESVYKLVMLLNDGVESKFNAAYLQNFQRVKLTERLAATIHEMIE
jgi:hypothetical protein